ncbi:MAG: hypothetical protein RI897_3024 [Verrucomicrobiota bacterium]
MYFLRGRSMVRDGLVFGLRRRGERSGGRYFERVEFNAEQVEADRAGVFGFVFRVVDGFEDFDFSDLID